MSFYKETIVKKPRKKYKCSLCGKEIAGEHFYVASSDDNDCWFEREHTACHEKAQEMCDKCGDQSWCDRVLRECFQEMLLQEKGGE